MNSSLLQPFESKFLGSMKNRVVMSAMTRGFADANHCCTPDMAAYYARRAENGIAFLLTEGIIIHPSADGYNHVPHLWTDQQAESWKPTVNAVHDAGSKMYAQLWHCGRISHPDYTGGEAPVSSTNQPAQGTNRQNDKPYGQPRPLTEEEIPGIYELFVASAKKAFAAGFDGIELHGGHGYLIDQFFDSRVNDRTDNYGGSVKNRCRFALELTECMIKEFGPEKLMIRLSPSRFMGGLYNWPEMDEMLDYLIPALDQRGLRQLDISCANANYFETSGLVIEKVRKMWPHFLMGGASLSHEDAAQQIDAGLLDMVTWARHILANPDFVTKLTNDEPLLEMTNEMRSTLY